ncbi:response regulator [bacterium]|nr:response regulator [bacterium]
MARRGMPFTKKIVLIDDDLEFMKIVADTLGLLGYHSLLFQNPRQALETVQQIEIGLVITDFHMQEMTALDVIKAIKTHDASIPVIVVTGDLSLETEKASMQRGAYAYIYKPVDFNKLIRLTAKICDKTKKRQVDSL